MSVAQCKNEYHKKNYKKSNKKILIYFIFVHTKNNKKYFKKITKIDKKHII